MIYEITSKSDFQVGATLVTRIPEEAVDNKAFYTMLSSLPEFLLPFTHRSVDGQVELTYEIGKNTKLAYLSGNFPPPEYSQLWSSVLSPVLDCDDWFLEPFSFVLSCEYLYYDKDRKQVKYLYIPSVKQVSDNSMLKDMVDELAEQITVTDAGLENKVLKSIKKDFSPKDFLLMLKPYQTGSVQSGVSQQLGHGGRGSGGVQPSYPSAPQPHLKDSAQAAQAAQQLPQQPSKQQSQQNTPVATPPASVGASGAQAYSAPVRQDDIVINIPADGKASKDFKKEDKEAKKLAKKEEKDSKKEAKLEAKENKKNKADGKASKVKPAAEFAQGKEKKGMFGGKKKAEPSGIMMGAAAEQQPNYMQQTPQVQHTPAQGGHYQPAPIVPAVHETDAATDIDEDVAIAACGLQLVSHLNLPKTIRVNIDVGRNFSIGRYDAVVGAKQSDFEFDKNTKAVSRRHAVIERRAEGYFIVDIGSSAGTFVNNAKIVPNALHPISNGDKVSIGNAGADYVWEEV